MTNLFLHFYVAPFFKQLFFTIDNDFVYVDKTLGRNLKNLRI